MTNPRGLVHSVRLCGDVGSGVSPDRTIKAGKNRLDERIVQHLHDRLPGGDVRPREFAFQVDLSCDLLRVAILEKMGGAADH